MSQGIQIFSGNLKFLEAVLYAHTSLLGTLLYSIPMPWMHIYCIDDGHVLLIKEYLDTPMSAIYSINPAWHY